MQNRHHFNLDLAQQQLLLQRFFQDRKDILILDYQFTPASKKPILADLKKAYPEIRHLLWVQQDDNSDYVISIDLSTEWAWVISEKSTDEICQNKSFDFLYDYVVKTRIIKPTASYNFLPQFIEVAKIYSAENTIDEAFLTNFYINSALNPSTLMPINYKLKYLIFEIMNVLPTFMQDEYNAFIKLFNLSWQHQTKIETKTDAVALTLLSQLLLVNAETTQKILNSFDLTPYHDITFSPAISNALAILDETILNLCDAYALDKVTYLKMLFAELWHDDHGLKSVWKKLFTITLSLDSLNQRAIGKLTAIVSDLLLGALAKMHTANYPAVSNNFIANYAHYEIKLNTPKAHKDAPQSHQHPLLKFVWQRQKIFFSGWQTKEIHSYFNYYIEQPPATINQLIDGLDSDQVNAFCYTLIDQFQLSALPSHLIDFILALPEAVRLNMVANYLPVIKDEYNLTRLLTSFAQLDCVGFALQALTLQENFHRFIDTLKLLPSHLQLNAVLSSKHADSLLDIVPDLQPEQKLAFLKAKISIKANMEDSFFLRELDTVLSVFLDNYQRLELASNLLAQPFKLQLKLIVDILTMVNFHQAKRWLDSHAVAPELRFVANCYLEIENNCPVAINNDEHLFACLAMLKPDNLHLQWLPDQRLQLIKHYLDSTNHALDGEFSILASHLDKDFFALYSLCQHRLQDAVAPLLKLASKNLWQQILNPKTLTLTKHFLLDLYARISAEQQSYLLDEFSSYQKILATDFHIELSIIDLIEFTHIDNHFLLEKSLTDIQAIMQYAKQRAKHIDPNTTLNHIAEKITHLAQLISYCDEFNLKLNAVFLYKNFSHLIFNLDDLGIVSACIKHNDYAEFISKFIYLFSDRHEFIQFTESKLSINPAKIEALYAASIKRHPEILKLHLLKCPAEYRYGFLQQLNLNLTLDKMLELRDYLPTTDQLSFVQDHLYCIKDMADYKRITFKSYEANRALYNILTQALLKTGVAAYQNFFQPTDLANQQIQPAPKPLATKGNSTVSKDKFAATKESPSTPFFTKPVKILKKSKTYSIQQPARNNNH